MEYITGFMSTLTNCLPGSEHNSTADGREAAEGAVQTEVSCIACDHAAQDLRNGAHAVCAAGTYAQHHFGAQHAANEHAEQMPVLCPGNEYVAQANQIELHDQGVKAGHIVELLALAAAACQLVYHITLVIRHIVGIAAAVQITCVAGELGAGIQFGCSEDDAGHEPGGGYLAQKDDENGA